MASQPDQQSVGGGSPQSRKSNRRSHISYFDLDQELKWFIQSVDLGLVGREQTVSATHIALRNSQMTSIQC